MFLEATQGPHRPMRILRGDTLYLFELRAERHLVGTFVFKPPDCGDLVWNSWELLREWIAQQFSNIGTEPSCDYPGEPLGAFDVGVEKCSL